MKKKIVALLLSVMMIFGLLPASVFSAAETPDFVEIDGKWYEVSAIADTPTDTPTVSGANGTFKTEGGDGRVWTDKSVSVNNDGDIPSFDVTLSTVGQVYESVKSGTFQNKADVLFILDASVSMEDSDIDAASGSGNITRIQALVSAVNKALGIIFDANPDNRVMITTYKENNGNYCEVLLPLGSYKPNANGEFITWGTRREVDYFFIFPVGYSTYYYYSTASDLQVKNSSNTYVNYSHANIELGSYTFIQAGIQRGINSLIDEINSEMGTEKNRADTKTMPYVLLLTDGDANVASNTITGKITNGSTDFSGSEIAARTILTAAYWKDQLTALYRDYNPQIGGSNDTSIEAKFYTIGLSSDATINYNPALLAPQLLLNEFDNGVVSWNSTTATRVLKTGISGDGEISITRNNANNVRSRIVNLTSSNAALSKYNPDTGNNFIYTTDAYYSQAESQASLEQAFETLANDVMDDTIKKSLPVSFESVDPAVFGGVKFIDNIGSGMTVDATSTSVFTAKVGTGASAVSYTLSYNSALSDSSKYVYTTSDGEMLLIIDKSGANNVVTWEVPAELIPLFDKVRNAANEVSYVDASPIRLTYNVHPSDEALSSLSGEKTFLCGSFTSGSRGTAESIYEPQEDNPHFFVFDEAENAFVAHDRFKDASLVNVAKKSNATNTASNAGEAVFPVKTSGDAKVMVNYLGNNGKLTLTPVSEAVTPVSITLKKVDGASGNNGILPGAVFTVTKSGASTGTDYTVGTDGTVAIKFTSSGTYTISEKTAPAGYQKNTTVYTVNVTQGAFAKPEKNTSGDYVSSAALAVESVKTGSPLASSSDYASGTLTVKDIPNTITISGSKSWNDSDFAALTGYSRPDEIEITLVEVKGSTETKVTQTGLTNPVSAKKANEYAFSFAGLPEYRDGVKIVYAVKETAVNGYSATYPADTYNIVNNVVTAESDIYNSVTVTVKKVDSATNNPLAGAIFTIYKEDGTTKVADFPATGVDGTATYTFTTAAEIGSYKIKETTAPTGYKINSTVYPVTVGKTASAAQKTADGKWQTVYDLTVTGTSSGVITVADETTTVDLTLTKEWYDNSDSDGFRPTSVSFHLTRQIEGGAVEYIMDGANKKVFTIAKPAVASNTWTLTVENLPAYKDGKKYTYRIIELNAEGAEITGDSTFDTNYDVPQYRQSGGNYIIAVNSYNSTKINIIGSKSWNDSDFAALTGYSRPDEIKVTLVEIIGGKEEIVTISGLTNPVTATKADDYAFSFEDLPEYRDGEKIVYAVRETAINGYSATYDDDTYTIVNNIVTSDSDVYNPVTVTVKKVDSVTNNPLAGAIFTLYKADGTTKIKDLDATGADGKATVTFSAASDVAEYVIKETTAPAGYVASTAVYKFEVKKSLTGAQQDKDGKWQKVYNLTVTGTSDGVIAVANSATNISLTITKNWNDDSNRDGKRPESVSFVLTRQIEGGAVEYIMDGANKKVFTIAKPAAASNTWTLTVENLPAYKDGKKYTYRIIELNAEGAEITGEGTFDANYGTPLYSQDSNGNYTIAKNTETLGTVKIEGTKIWRDTDSSKRPGSITINLVGKVGDETVVNEKCDTNASLGWKYSFDNLYKYKDGVEIVYTVSELTVNGYKAIVDGYNVTNIELITVGGDIGWEGDDDIKDTSRPDSVTVIIYQGSGDSKVQVGEPITVTGADDWTWAVSGLPKYDTEGNLIVYSIKEDLIDGYTPSYDGTDIKNTVKTTKAYNTVTFDIKKIDGASSTGVGLKNAVYTLTKSGSSAGTDYTTSENGKVTITVSAPGTYTLKEKTAPAGYVVSDTVYTVVIGETSVVTAVEYLEENDTYKKTLNLTVESTTANGSAADYKDGVLDVTDKSASVTASGSVTWSDDDFKNIAGYARPEEVEVTLVEIIDGKEVKVDIPGLVNPVIANKAGEYKYSFANLPEYRDGEKIVYAVRETALKGYTTEYPADTYDIVNNVSIGNGVFNPVTVTVKKVDSATGNSLDGAIFTLYSADGTTKIAEFTETGNKGFSAYTFTDGTEIGKYVIKETTAPEGYKLSDASYEVEVGKAIVSAQQNADGSWQTVYDLTVIGAKDGVIIAADETKTVDVDITINWNDDSNRDGKRPDSVSFHLIRQIKGGETEYVMDGESKKVFTVNKPAEASDTWTITVPDMDEYKDGYKYLYGIIELDSEGSEIIDGTLDDNYGVPQYSQSESENYTVVSNTHTSALIKIEGVKTWRDTDGSKRPGTVTIKLAGKVGDETVVTATATTSAEADWKYVFDNLYKYDNGVEITYSVSELTVDGYKAIVDGYNVTNIELISIDGSLTWEGDEDIKDTSRPDSITIIIYQGEGESRVQVGDPIIVTEADNWTWDANGLPKYDTEGNLIVYTIEQSAVDGYTTTYDGTDIVNTVKVTETNNSVAFYINKVDAATKTGKGLAGATFVLTDKNGRSVNFTTGADGKAYVDIYEAGTYTLVEKFAPVGYVVSDTVYTVVASADKTDFDVKFNKATGTFEKSYALDIEFVTSGRTAADYIANGRVLTVTNSSELISVSVKKVWDDDNNKDGIRPESINVKLLKQVGTEEAVELENVVITLSEDNGWSAVLDNLSKYEDGQLVNYTVKEVTTDIVTGEDGKGTYSVAIVGDSSTGYIITNTHTSNPETSDTDSFTLWAAVCMATVTALAVVFFARKKNEEN